MVSGMNYYVKIENPNVTDKTVQKPSNEKIPFLTVIN